MSGDGLDDQQEEFLMKKSTVLPGQSAKNSHVFSDMYLQRADKVKPKIQRIEKKKKESPNAIKYSFDQQYISSKDNILSQLQDKRQDMNSSSNFPKIVQKSREIKKNEL